MATLKFGNGNWASKKEAVLAYNDENNNFKPLPFTFDRASSATVVNKDGLIETVGVDEPRIDFSNDSKGALLLEPSRQNLITYSEDFSQWTNNGGVGVISSSEISPDGTTNAYDLTDGGSNYRFLGSNSVAFNGTYTASIFIKKTTGLLSHYAGLEVCLVGSYVIINTTNGDINQTGSDYSNIKSEDFGDWWRISVTVTNSDTGSILQVWSAISSNGTSISPSANGTNTFFGAMVEQGSYPTSYIPTQGSAVTRSAETCSQTPPDGVIGQTEGVLFIDFTPNTDTISTKWLSFLGGGSQYIAIYVVNTSNVIRLEVANTTNQATFNSSFSITKGTRYKCAIAYANNDFTAYINGVQLGTVTSGSVPATSTLKSYYNLSSIESFNTKDLRLYNTRLSNSELQALTTL